MEAFVCTQRMAIEVNLASISSIMSSLISSLECEIELESSLMKFTVLSELHQDHMMVIHSFSIDSVAPSSIVEPNIAPPRVNICPPAVDKLRARLMKLAKYSE